MADHSEYLPNIIAMRVHEAAWEPSHNVSAKRLLLDNEAVSVTVTYDDGSQVVFHRWPLLQPPPGRANNVCDTCGGSGWIDDDPADSGGHPCPHCLQYGLRNEISP